MTLLVTGGCGFIGSEVVRQAVNQGRSVVNIDSLTYAANQNNLNSINHLDNYEFKHIDICDRLSLEKVFLPASTLCSDSLCGRVTCRQINQWSRKIY